MTDQPYFDISQHISPWYLPILFLAIALLASIGTFRNTDENTRGFSVVLLIFSTGLLLMFLVIQVPEYVCYHGALQNRTYQTVSGNITRIVPATMEGRTRFLVGNVYFEIAPPKQVTAGFNNPQLLIALANDNKQVQLLYAPACPYPGVNPILYIGRLKTSPIAKRYNVIYEVPNERRARPPTGLTPRAVDGWISAIFYVRMRQTAFPTWRFTTTSSRN